jgi:hypothetical protein
LASYVHVIVLALIDYSIS